MPSSGRGQLALVSIALTLVGFVAIAHAGGLGKNPANSPKLLDEPIEELRYDRATHCTGHATKGAEALSDWIARNTRGEPWGIYRCEKWGKHSASVHAEGRALDYRLDAGIAKERRAAMHLIHLLIEPDRNGEPHALARRMGVQGLIFNCKSWYGGGELGRYSACYKQSGKRDPDVDRTTAHKDHVHIELTGPARARRRASGAARWLSTRGCSIAGDPRCRSLLVRGRAARSLAPDR